MFADRVDAGQRLAALGWNAEMLAYCRGRGIVIQAYSQLARAVRLGDRRLARIGAGYGKPSAQILTRSGIQSGVVPPPKAADLGLG